MAGRALVGVPVLAPCRGPRPGVGQRHAIEPHARHDARLRGARTAGGVRRLAEGWPEHAGARVAGLLATLAAPLLLVTWLGDGPLASGWAAAEAPRRRTSAGAGRRLSRRSGRRPCPQRARCRARRSPRSASGSFTRQPSGNERVTLDLAPRLSGGASGDLSMVLGGQPTNNGGVLMDTSRVRLAGDGGSPVYDGRVTALDGNRIVANVARPAGSVDHAHGGPPHRRVRAHHRCGPRRPWGSGRRRTRRACPRERPREQRSMSTTMTNATSFPRLLADLRPDAPPALEDHLARFGRVPWQGPPRRGTSRLIAIIEASGLRGRGGGAFRRRGSSVRSRADAAGPSSSAKRRRRRAREPQGRVAAVHAAGSSCSMVLRLPPRLWAPTRSSWPLTARRVTPCVPSCTNRSTPTSRPGPVHLAPGRRPEPLRGG